MDYICLDCNKELEIKGEELIGGKVLIYDTDQGKVGAVKCDECFEKNPALKDFQDCQVFSRVVGYITQTDQWNQGKKQEFKDRKTYKIEEWDADGWIPTEKI